MKDIVKDLSLCSNISLGLAVVMVFRAGDMASWKNVLEDTLK